MFLTLTIENYLVLAHLFVKVPKPGDSKVTFSVFRITLLLPV